MTRARSTMDISSILEAQVTRRTLLAGSASLLLLGRASGASERHSEFTQGLREIQARIGGRLGVHVLDTGSAVEITYSGDDRFAMCSTFKLLLAAAVLERVDAGKLDLDQRIAFGSGDMLSHAPVTSARLDQGAISIRDLCAAIVEVSDNPAANLLLPLVQGPRGLTQFLRRTGDEITRLDRTELDLNTNLPGDPRDTTTPRAMVRTVRKLLTGDVLSEASRAQLIAWLVRSQTGVRRIRAGLPSDWKVGDKTGTGANGAVNNVAIAWPPQRPPVIAAVLMSESKLPESALEAAHAQIGKLVGGIVFG
jgi:beta-lactamase class A